MFDDRQVHAAGVIVPFSVRQAAEVVEADLRPLVAVFGAEAPVVAEVVFDAGFEVETDFGGGLIEWRAGFARNAELRHDAGKSGAVHAKHEQRRAARDVWREILKALIALHGIERDHELVSVRGKLVLRHVVGAVGRDEGKRGVS